MDPRYARNVPALTVEECRLLAHKRVLIVGCGGLGGHLVELLARVGVGFIRAVDGDVFEFSNLNRQLLSEMPYLGLSKAHAAADRVSRINPHVQVEARHCYLNEDNAQQLVSGCDVVLDALDNVESRRILAAECERQKVPYIYGAISGWVAQAAVSLPGDKLIDTLFPEGIAIRDKSVLSFTPAMCASMQAALCIKLLTGRPVENGTIYYFDLLNQEFEAICLA